MESLNLHLNAPKQFYKINHPSPPLYSIVAYVTYTKEDGTKTTLTRPSTENGVFERIVGPVYKGFSCTFSIDRGTGINDIPLRIEIKKNDEPFVVKVEGIYSVKYTIE